MALLRLSRLCDRDDYRESAERTLLAAGEILVKQSAACGALLSALDRYQHDNEQIVLAVKDSETMAALSPTFLEIVPSARNVVMGPRRCSFCQRQWLP